MKPYYEHGGITIYHGDCREWIYPHGDVLVTDPPYGIAHESNYGASWQGTQIANDGSVDAREHVLAVWGERPALLFGTWKAPRPDGVKQVLIWDKGPAFGMGDLKFPWKNSFDEIYVLGRGFRGESRDEAVLRGFVMPSWEKRGRQHPNQKPESLLLYLINRCPDGTICDPFMGSGTTLVAAKRLGRQAIGVEIEERYCEIAARRLQQEALPLEVA